MASDPTLNELRISCRANARLLAEMIAFYMPTVNGLRAAADGRYSFAAKDAIVLAERAFPYLARAGAALRWAEELGELADPKGPLDPLDDPRIGSPLMRAIAESLLAAVTAKSGEDLKKLPLLTQNRLIALGAAQPLRQWLARHANYSG